MLSKFSTLFILISCISCNNQPPCKCDLNHEDFFLESGRIIKYNTPEHLISEVNISSLKKIANLDIRGSIPIPGFDKYYFDVKISTDDKSDLAIRKQLFFIKYCTLFPSYHMPPNCASNQKWLEKKEELMDELLPYKPTPPRERKSKLSIELKGNSGNINIINGNNNEIDN